LLRITGLSSHRIRLPSDRRTGTVCALFVVFFTVILNSPSPSGLVNLMGTLGGIASAVNSTAPPARNAGRPVSAQTRLPLPGAGQAAVPSFDHGDSSRPFSIDQPNGTEAASSAWPGTSDVAS